jgi:predicted transcriptional regulator of viral defense system
MNTFFLDWFLDKYDHPIITRHELFKAIFELCVLVKVEENINLNPKSQYFKAVEQLASSKHVACHHKTQFGYSFFSKSKDSISSEELICLLFPYGSLAYGSALSELDLTGVKSKSVYFKTPSRSVWKKKALSDLPVVPEHLKKHFHLAKYSDYMLPIYPYEDIFINKQLIVLSEKNLNLENIITKENLRIQNHFDLLLDSLRKPQYCGGFSHIFEIFNNHIDRFLEGLINYASNEGTCIDRARLGFILEKMLFIKHPIFIKWKTEMKDKRGGSRKLISANDFDEHFDSDWNISLNHSLAQNPPKSRNIRFH